MNAANSKAVESAANRVTLDVVVNKAVRELYGTAEPVLDEIATLRRVALFYRGTGRYVLTQEERDVALEVIRARFDVQVQ